MKVFPKLSLTLPSGDLQYSDTAVYDPEDHVIHLNIRKLKGHPLFFFRVFAHELMHHIFSPAAKRGKINIDNRLWRFFNWKWK
jgi:hypothetical protein